MIRIKQLRNSKGLKQIDLCKQLGVTQGALSGWENGKYEPDITSLKKMSEIFEVSIDYILGKDDYLLGNDMEPSNLSAISTDTGEPPYFLDDEAREIAEELSKNPNLHILFDAARGVSADDLRFVIDMVNRFKQESE